MSEKEEQASSQGSRSAWLTVLQTALGHLGYTTETLHLQHVKWIVEREQTVQMLRIACRDHGDNDWPNDLHLADVIEKHLVRHIDTGDDE